MLFSLSKEGLEFRASQKEVMTEGGEEMLEKVGWVVEGDYLVVTGG